jgi:hypothetical protein
VGRIFVCAIYSDRADSTYLGERETDDGTAVRAIVSLRDRAIAELRTRGMEAISVPDGENTRQTIEWIERRALPADIALGIYADARQQEDDRPICVYHIAHNEERQQHARMLLLSLASRLPNLTPGILRPDTATALGNLAFCRQLSVPSLLLELSPAIPAADRDDWPAAIAELALGIADGLVAWNRDRLMSVKQNSHPVGMTMKVNGKIDVDRGIFLEGNAFIPIDLADRLGANLASKPHIRRLQYRGTVYVKAIELRDYHVGIAIEPDGTWDLRTELPVKPGDFERIVGKGLCTVEQLGNFLDLNDPGALARFPDLPSLYVEESHTEGINADFAWVQMCVETRFLAPTAVNSFANNNFGGLGDDRNDWASFASSRLGVRAHVQHLKAYSSHDDLVLEPVSPRFESIRRGVAPTFYQLVGRWSADDRYALRLAAALRQLYEFAGIF